MREGRTRINAGPTERAPAAETVSPAFAGALALRFLFPVTIGLGAFLLFLLEPLFAKLILPRFGGAAAVWAACLVFFQTALLGGYYYADVLTRRCPPLRQSLVHSLTLLLSLLFLPIAPRLGLLGSAPGANPALRILWLLATSIGLPFVLLSATSPLLQAWYARAFPERQPYPLFAVSNLASLAALLSFPFAIEPHLRAHAQSLLWSWLFAVFVALCIAVAMLTAKLPSLKAGPIAEETTEPTPPSGADKLVWLALAACGSTLLLSVTNKLLEDVAPVPLLWVLPLALYLLTFALAFSRRPLYPRALLMRMLAVTLGGLGYAIYDPIYTESLQVSLPVFVLGLFFCCWFCHGELARLRPAPRYSTSYYLMIAAGGAVGAILVGLLAPNVFRATYELPLALSLTAVLAILAFWRQGWLSRIFWMGAAVAMLFVLGRNARELHQNAIVSVRSFYGALRVREFHNWLKEPYRTLYHGRIEHGSQYVDAPQSLLPTTYYAPDSGVGVALLHCCPDDKRVGAIGLGTGTIAAYGKKLDYFRFYEINPQVVTIARTYFTYLRDSPAKIDVVMGDARLSLESEAPQEFDVLAVDAFSGDAIPVHLLTREAFALYLRHLKPGGILAVHTSNTYLKLSPVVQLLAEDAHCDARMILNEDNPRKLIDASDWVLVTRNKRFLDEIDTSVWTEAISVPANARLWTDDYNNLFQILRPVNFKSSAPPR